MNKQQLSTKIWAMANVLRGKVDANDYKDFLLGIIFYKFLSVKEENFMISKGMDSSEFNEYLTDTSAPCSHVSDGKDWPRDKHGSFSRKQQVKERKEDEQPSKWDDWYKHLFDGDFCQS